LWTRSDYQQPPLTEQDLCNAGRCDFCNTNASYLNCQAFVFGYLKLIGIMMGIILFFLMLPWIIAFCVIIVKCCQCVCFPVIKFVKKNHQNNKIKKLSKMINPTFNDDENDLEMTNSQDTNTTLNDQDYEEENVVRYIENGEIKTMLLPRKKKAPLNSVNVQLYVVLIIFSLGFIPVINAQCSTSAIASSMVNDCVRYNSTHESCKIKPIITSALKGVGDESCMDVTVNGTRVGKINVKFNTFVAKTNLVKEYYTSSWEGLCESSKSCFLEQCCTYDSYETCGDWAQNRLDDPNPCNKFSSGIMNVPGWTDCFSGNGCAACNCFSCANACMYYRYAFRPKGTVATIYSFGLTTYEATLIINWNFTESGGSSGQNIVTTTNPYFSNSIFDMTMQGVFIDFAIGFGDKRLFAEGTTSKFVDAAKTNQPAKGIIGDIQSTNVVGLSSPTSTSFRYASNLVRINQDCSRSYCTFEGPGYNYQEFFVKLPQSLSGFIWQYSPSNQFISANVARSLSALYTLKFKNDVQILLFSDVVCPIAKFVSSVGCFQCTDGANVTIDAYSECLPGTCSVFSNSSTVEVVTTSLFLTNVPSKQIIVINAGVANLDTMIYLNCRGNIIPINITGTLIDKDTIYQDQNVTVVVPPDSGSSVDLGGLFGLGEEIAAIIIMIVVIIGTILLFLLIVYIVYKCGCCCKGKNNNTDGNFSSFGKSLKTMMGITAIQAAISNKKLKNAGYNILTKDQKLDTINSDAIKK